MTTKRISYAMTQLFTEQSNPKSTDLDILSVGDILRLINEEDHMCAEAVKSMLPLIEIVVENIVDRFSRGGRILYLGAGTSGRIAIMDAAEIPPTFGIDPERIQARMAGGQGSVVRAQEQHEDNVSEGAAAVREWGASELDCVIGLATSGKTPYVISGLEEARHAGAFTAFICANLCPEYLADVVIQCITGPEVLTGSTRMKAGTAQKMMLNMISTAAMVKLGRTYQNRMSHIATGNVKLYSRAIETLSMCCDVSPDEAKELLHKCGCELPLALVVGIGGCELETARHALEKAGGKVRAALAQVRG